jgi:hypothetical protein
MCGGPAYTIQEVESAGVTRSLGGSVCVVS